jgi:hypothetical protein
LTNIPKKNPEKKIVSFNLLGYLYFLVRLIYFHNMFVLLSCPHLHFFLKKIPRGLENQTCMHCSPVGPVNSMLILLSIYFCHEKPVGCVPMSAIHMTESQTLSFYLLVFIVFYLMFLEVPFSITLALEQESRDNSDCQTCRSLVGSLNHVTASTLPITLYLSQGTC